MRDPVPTLIGWHRPMARTRVLVVDDEDLICTVFARILRDRHDVVGLTNGRAALALIEAGQQFDAVFCDILMPTMRTHRARVLEKPLNPDVIRAVSARLTMR